MDKATNGNAPNLSQREIPRDDQKRDPRARQRLTSTYPSKSERTAGENHETLADNGTKKWETNRYFQHHPTTAFVKKVHPSIGLDPTRT